MTHKPDSMSRDRMPSGSMSSGGMSNGDDPDGGDPSDRPAWYRRVGNRLRVFGKSRRKKGPAEPNPSSGLRIMIVTDAWTPQVNGVVRTLETLRDQLTLLGNEVRMITPDMFQTVPMPTYSEIRLAVWPNRKVAKVINEFQPHAIHIATEGPLGLTARRFCLRRDHPFTTSLHTRFPEYVNARIGFPVSWGYALMRRFHRPASAVMVATPSLMQEMEGRGFGNLRIWSRGVDTNLFQLPPDLQEDPHTSDGPQNHGDAQPYGDNEPVLPYPRPTWLYVGRVAVEKNVEAFLKLGLEGTKVVVGDGPQLTALRGAYPDAKFLGARFKEDLARVYAASDVFVFPSKTDTFGLVNVEALACGTPVAAYPLPGPVDIVVEGETGALDHDLEAACCRALEVAGRPGSAAICRDRALEFSWDACTRQFLVNLDLPGFDEDYWEESAKLPD